MNSIKLIPIKVERQTSQFNLIDCLLDSLNKNSQKLLDYDILTISSKFVSLSEGRFVKLSDISVSSFADKLSKKYNINPNLSELIFRESDEIFSGSDGFVLTFTQPVDSGTATNPKSYVLTSYTYPYHSRYGGEETDVKTLTVKSATLDAAKQSVHLKIDDLRAGYVHELHADGIRDPKGQTLLHEAAYYTLNRIPK